MAKDSGFGGGRVAKEPFTNGATAQSAEVDASGVSEVLSRVHDPTCFPISH